MKLEIFNSNLQEKIGNAKTAIGDFEEKRGAHIALQEQVQRDQIRYNENQGEMLQLQDEVTSLRELLTENEESVSKLKLELRELKDQHATAESDMLPVGSDPPVVEDDVSGHLSSVKDAFHMQAAVLEDVKLSETMLESLINEVMKLATQSELEMLELSSVLGTADDLLLNPSSILDSLDLAGVDSSEFYFREVRSRLEDLAALAYTTSVELSKRKTQFTQWKSNRAESPSIPVTPPCSKQLNRTIFESEDSECSGESSGDFTPVITDGAKEVRDKLAGARLLCCILENHNKMEVASAFRKWTCAVGAINASSNASSHQETAVELAHELEITREKLMALKSHLKAGRGGKEKPRLRRILERLDGNALNQANNLNSKPNKNNMVHAKLNRNSARPNECSFEL